MSEQFKLGIKENDNFIGIFFKGKEAINTFISITCPCGVNKSFPLNKVPEEDTLHPCGNPNHYSVKYEK